MNEYLAFLPLTLWFILFIVSLVAQDSWSCFYTYSDGIFGKLIGTFVQSIVWIVFGATIFFITIYPVYLFFTQE